MESEFFLFGVCCCSRPGRLEIADFLSYGQMKNGGFMRCRRGSRLCDRQTDSVWSFRLSLRRSLVELYRGTSGSTALLPFSSRNKPWGTHHMTVSCLVLKIRTETFTHMSCVSADEISTGRAAF